MKKTSIFKIIPFVLFCSLFYFSVAQAQDAGERIESFDTALVVQQDNSVSVTEKITYAFPSEEERHGIYRTIPLKGIQISNITVTDESGIKQPFSISRGTGNEKIKIGDKDIVVKGMKTYVISYKVTGAISDLKDIDELYWNATGDEWEYPIVRSQQTITLPGLIQTSDLKVSCYYGARGSTTSCNDGVSVTEDNGLTHVTITQQSSLAAGEGVTIAIGFPKGMVTHPTVWQRFVMSLQHNIGVILSGLFLIIASVYSVFRWRKYGREPKDAGVIIAHYDAPDALHPAEMSALLSKAAKDSDISAEIINLAVKGYLKIERIETKVLFFKKKDDYTLTLLKDVSEASDEFDQKLLAGLFGSTAVSGDSTLLSDLKNSFYSTVADTKKRVMESLVSRKYFLKNPTTTYTIAIVVFVGGLFVAFIGGAIVAAVSGVWYQIPILIVAVAVIAIFIALSTPRTEKGVAAKEHSLGLKEYLQIAEKDRINFHNAPEKNPELFEKLLPYAMVLGVEKAWAKEFEGIYVTPPTWYADSSMNGFNSVILVNSFSNFNTAAASSFSAPVTSASSGGGYSGGGSGGGGGGSW